VAVVQDKPLLLVGLGTNQNRNLTLLVRLGTNYQMQFSTNLSSGWYPAMNYLQTNGAITISIDSSNAVIFFRLYQP
jgi:hypothetical protein